MAKKVTMVVIPDDENSRVNARTRETTWYVDTSDDAWVKEQFQGTQFQPDGQYLGVKTRLVETEMDSTLPIMSLARFNEVISQLRAERSQNERNRALRESSGSSTRARRRALYTLEALAKDTTGPRITRYVHLLTVFAEDGTTPICQLEVPASPSNAEQACEVHKMIENLPEALRRRLAWIQTERHGLPTIEKVIDRLKKLQADHPEK
jgi:hypothetical protein